MSIPQRASQVHGAKIIHLAVAVLTIIRHWHTAMQKKMGRWFTCIGMSKKLKKVVDK